MTDEDSSAWRIHNCSYRWSGGVDAVGDSLLIPWLDEKYTEAGSVWLHSDRAFELAVALIAHQAPGSDFLNGLMWQALADVVPEENLEEAVERAQSVAVLAAEHAARRARRPAVPTVKARRPAGTTTVEPAGDYKGVL